MYGEPALPPDFVSLPQANPDAPKGGSGLLSTSVAVSVPVAVGAVSSVTAPEPTSTRREARVTG